MVGEVFPTIFFLFLAANISNLPQGTAPYGISIAYC